MKKDSPDKNIFLTRAELINSSRLKPDGDCLPKQCKEMFDDFGAFKQGSRAFIDLTQQKKS